VSFRRSDSSLSVFLVLVQRRSVPKAKARAMMVFLTLPTPSTMLHSMIRTSRSCTITTATACPRVLTPSTQQHIRVSIAARTTTVTTICPGALTTAAPVHSSVTSQTRTTRAARAPLRSPLLLPSSRPARPRTPLHRAVNLSLPAGLLTEASGASASVLRWTTSPPPRSTA
jgi:hypothetical protein